VIPCFNDGRVLPDALASLEGQEPCEVVVVDDGSTEDATRRLLDALPARGIDVIRQSNAGPSAARMAGLASTMARYIVPLDADDMISPGAIAALADALDADPKAAVAWGDVQTFGESTIRVRAPRQLDPWLLTYINLMPIVAMYRRDALLSAGGWQLARYEDWDLWMTAAESGWKGIYVDRVVERSRLHGPRKRRRDFTHHDETESLLLRRHPALVRHRSVLRHRSPAPWPVKTLLPLLERLPMAGRNRHRLYNALCLPAYLARLKGGQALAQLALRRVSDR
jgi:glycosyltransferase involved in cell wall biosynthesis